MTTDSATGIPDADLATGIPDADLTAVRRLLAPRSLALVGASERSRWAMAILDNLQAHGYPGPVHLVNPSGRTVRGAAVATSCAALGEEVDLGIVVVPAAAAEAAVTDLAAAGARSAVVLTSGFAETGEAGQARQDALVAAAGAGGVRLLGPNSLGFIDTATHLVPWAAPIEVPARGRGIALVSQSGATAYFLTRLAVEQHVDLRAVVATGNEADLDVATVAASLVGEPTVTAIAVFAESIRRPDRFAAAAEAARAAHIPLVVLKVGSSEVSARSALAHTGAVVGDDRVFDGVCSRYGVVRVDSLEQLVASADIMGRTGPLRPGGLCLVSNSGGVCEIGADRAGALGIDMPPMPAEVAEALRADLPDYATAHNPLDITGGVEPDGCGRVIARLAEVDQYAAVLVPFYPLPADGGLGDERLRNMHHHILGALREAKTPGFLATYANGTVSEAAARRIDDEAMPYLACGMDRALVALAGAMWWSRHLDVHEASAPGPAAVTPGAPITDRPTTEVGVLGLLAEHGVPVVPHVLAADEATAVEAAARWGGPVAVKVASAAIAHKSEIGGVALGASGAEAVAAAWRQVTDAGLASLGPSGGTLDGAVVMPMRSGGVELFVGCSHDPVWGPVLAVGLGGIWIEVLADVAVRPLPVTPTEVAGMLTSLRGARLLAGERGAPAVDLGAVAAAVAAIGDVAVGLGADLAALDVNPLWVRGSEVEALDGLAVWAAPTAPVAGLGGPVEPAG